MENMSIVFLAFANLAGLVAVIVVNALANILPFNGAGTGEISDLYPNLFVPAGITFSIWGLIYLLLGAFCAYSLVSVFGGRLDAGFITRINVLFLITCVMNTGWIFAWHWRHPGISLILMTGLLLSLAAIYLRLNSAPVPDTGTLIFVRLPFSVYLGWITVATIANIAAFLVGINWSGFGIRAEVWTIIVIAAAAAIGCGVVLVKGDTGYAVVIIWALTGIILKRHAASDAPAVSTAAFAGIGLIAASIPVKFLLMI